MMSPHFKFIGTQIIYQLLLIVFINLAIKRLHSYSKLVHRELHIRYNPYRFTHLHFVL